MNQDGPDDKDKYLAKKPSETPDFHSRPVLSGNAAQMFMPSKGGSTAQPSSTLASLGIPIAGLDNIRVKKSVGPDGAEEYDYPDDDQE
jgi:hypothetical protein